MRRLGKLWERIRCTLRNEPPDIEFQAEIEEHVSLLAERYHRQGMTKEAAMLAARRQFGNTTLLREKRRSLQTFPAFVALRGDLIYSARMLRRNPGFTAVVVITLALGIGANTAIFSVCDSVLFKPLPYAEPGRIVMLWERLREGALVTVAPANFVDWRRQSKSFSEIAALDPNPGFTLGGQDEAARLAGAAVSSNFFSALGVQPILGRSFLPEEDSPGKNNVAILSYRVWRERFGGDRDITGKSVTLNDNSYIVIGVLPADFQFASKAADFQARTQADIWVPLALNPQKLQRGTHPLRVVARLKPGVDLAHAQAELNVMAAGLAKQYPEDNRDRGIAAVPLTEQVTGNVRAALDTLLGAVGLLLLIACTNVANLLLSRAAARRNEMAVRVALGASRGRLAQQLLTESLLLAIIGGLAGFFFALAAIAALSPHLPADLSRAAGIAVNLRMLVFTAVISLMTGVLFGLGPLFGTRRLSAGEALKQNDRVAGGHHGLRNGLAVAQIAIAIILLIGAGLMAKSFWALMHVAPGFRSEGIVTARLSLPKSRYPDNFKIAAFERELLERLRGRPGIQSVGFATYLPLSGSDNGWAFIIEHRAPLPTGIFNFAKYRPVSGGYFETIGIPLLQGRTFMPSDTQESPWVVVINEAMAREFWGTENPIGQRLHFGSETWRTVVGVVGDVLHEGLDGETKPEMYVPVEQAPNIENGPTIVLRTALDPGTAAAELRGTVLAIDSTIPVDRIETMEQLVSGSVSQPRFRTVILVTFSMLALVIASIGIYGVMNYLVIQRTREFGIRLSVGATRGDVLWLVLGRAAVLITAGTCLGLAGSVLLVRLIAKLLFETAPLDPLTFASVPLLVGAVALAASYLPARRATQVDPMVALRYE
jgi:putative ABC transport system permease protein